MKRLENETIKEYLNRTTIQSKWLIDAKRRKRYRFFYKIRNKLKLILIRVKNVW